MCTGIVRYIAEFFHIPSTFPFEQTQLLLLLLLLLLLTYLLTYLLQLSFHSVAVVLSLIQTKQRRKIHINKTIKKHSTNNTKHSKYKFTYYQNTHTIVKTTPHAHTHTLQNPHMHTPTHQTTSSNNHSTRHRPNEIVTIQSSSLSKSSP